MHNHKDVYTQLINCLFLEVQRGGDRFSWRKTIHRALKCDDRQFYFWYRIWSYIYKTKKFKLHKIAKRKLRDLNRIYGSDISPDATIGENMRIAHYPGLVIRKNCIIGKNSILRQNTTLGAKSNNVKNKDPFLYIGDNVEIGANCCIIGDIKIGNNVIIGAGSFINKSIPDNCTAFCQKEIIIVQKCTDSNVISIKKEVNL